MLYTLREKLIAARDEVAEIIVKEHGKTLSDATGELMRAMQYVEHPCGIPELLKGSFSEDLGSGVDEYFIREPLGVFSILPPFNFPAMIALYFTRPFACGNTVVVKPSELCAMTMLRITELAEEFFLMRLPIQSGNGTRPVAAGMTGLLVGKPVHEP